MRVLAAVIALTITATGCGDTNAALGHVSESQRLSSDLLVQFTKAADAANRAVMADTDALSVLFADEARQAKAALQRDVDALRPILHDLNYDRETRLLQDFVARFAEYDALDRQVLDLAVENTNLKAQRLSFGAAQQAADEFREAIERLAPGGETLPAWRSRALAAGAVSAVREIQVLQAIHIANPDDATMTQFEERMSAWHAVARNNLSSLGSPTGGASKPGLAIAAAALERFIAVNAEIVALSRRNTNVRSLALSLDQKRTLVAPCEESARALRDALGKHGYPAGR